MTEPGNPEGLVSARHHLTNILLRYLDAVDAQDLDGVLELVGTAEVTFGRTRCADLDEVRQAYRAAFTTGGRTLHLMHPVQVSDDAGRIRGRAHYQRWSLDTPQATVTALGVYDLTIDRRDEKWHLTDFSTARIWQTTVAG